MFTVESNEGSVMVLVEYKTPFNILSLLGEDVASRIKSELLQIVKVPAPLVLKVDVRAYSVSPILDIVSTFKFGFSLLGGVIFIIFELEEFA